jgi:uncharacterized protein YjiS (DUF1127 family)
MATTEFSQTELAPSAQGVRNFVETAVARLARAWTAARNRRAVNQLLEWDSRMLADIGLTEGDVRSALAARSAEDPSCHLNALSHERKSARRARAHELYTLSD